MVSLFTAQERRILDLILRLSYGCHKKYAIIPRQSDFEVIGIGENKIKNHIDFLIENKIIFRDGIKYWFNKDYDQWRISRAKEYRASRLAEMIKLNLDTAPRAPVPAPSPSIPKQPVKKKSNHPYIAEMQTHLGYPEVKATDPIPNPAKEAAFIKKMESRGFKWPQILAIWKEKVKLKKGEFHSMYWVNEDIGGKVSGTGTHKQSSTKLPGRDGYTPPPADKELDSEV